LGQTGTQGKMGEELGGKVHRGENWGIGEDNQKGGIGWKGKKHLNAKSKV